MVERPKNSPIMDSVVRAIGRHVVTLSCMQKPAGSDKENPVVVSGFVVDVDGLWFYVTAGHVLREFEEALASGSTFDTWRLGDHSADGLFKSIGIPFDFSIDQWLVLRDAPTGLDYAAVLIRDFFRMALEAGQVVALGQDTWANQTVDYDHLLLVGVPAETVTHNGASHLSARVVAIPLHETDPPEGAEKKAQNQFFARLSPDSIARVADIRGMSGGPVFSFKRVNDGFKYLVIGVQSAWYDQSRIIAACPFSSFGAALQDVVRAAREEVRASAT